MSNTVQAAPASGDPSFEVALKELESIVEAMESGQLPLENLLEKYEAGSRLAQLCQRQLLQPKSGFNNSKAPYRATSSARSLCRFWGVILDSLKLPSIN